MSGSGPTAIGLFARPREEGVTLARAAAAALAEREPAPVTAVPVDAAFGEPPPSRPRTARPAAPVAAATRCRRGPAATAACATILR